MPPPFHYDERYFPLRLLTRYRYHLAHQLAREKAYCLTFLYLKASEYAHLRPFSDLFGAASRAVLQEFVSLEDIAAIPFEELVEFIDCKGKRRSELGHTRFRWRRHQPGDFQGEESRLTRAGNRYLRYYFCEGGNRVRMCDPEYAAYYDRKYREVQQHQHKRAMVLTGGNWFGWWFGC